MAAAIAAWLISKSPRLAPVAGIFIIAVVVVRTTPGLAGKSYSNHVVLPGFLTCMCAKSLPLTAPCQCHT